MQKLDIPNLCAKTMFAIFPSVSILISYSLTSLWPGWVFGYNGRFPPLYLTFNMTYDTTLERLTIHNYVYFICSSICIIQSGCLSHWFFIILIMLSKVKVGCNVMYTMFQPDVLSDWDCAKSCH